MLAGNSLKMGVGAGLEISSIYRHKKIEKISVGPFQPTYNHICRYLIHISNTIHMHGPRQDLKSVCVS